MRSLEIRRRFLQYFQKRGHAIISSSSVIPHDDPTLLFTNAGMNQFKDVFLGKNPRDYLRATTSQKCIRVGGKHNDLDNVGHTSRHLTFFEMLGNFSFGDYFKKEAIAFAWEVATQVFQFDGDKIWPTVYREDEEAWELWRQIVPANRITRFGERENFWAMGDTGPCGPCSELLLDRGPDYGSAITPANDGEGERYLEFWNLVFMQFYRDNNGKMFPLPKPSIDTGAGLERILALSIGADSVFATDILRALIGQIETIVDKSYDPHDSLQAPAFQVIADHVRSLAFAIADGAQPSNLDRGYVLRKLLRRAVRYGRILGLHEPFLGRVLPTLVDTMGNDYPELRTAAGRIEEILTLEEENFLRTLKRGGNILTTVLEKAQQSSHRQISGEAAFQLKDTYGFPLEEILLIAKDASVQVNLEQYQILEEKAKERSRSAQGAHTEDVKVDVFRDFTSRHAPSEFLGYQTQEVDATVLGLMVDGRMVEHIGPGDEGIVLLNHTPFYAEKGGQVGDTGQLHAEGVHFHVVDCQTPYPGVIAHIGKMTEGNLQTGDSLTASIDKARRYQIANHHTATHLLHWALQEVVGRHVRQAGSLVSPDRLRFDFHHHKPLSADELRSIERAVNRQIRANTPVTTYEMAYEDVRHKQEIQQFFGDKYGAIVRVVDIDFSKELCGGTHASHLGTIGLFRIVRESSIAAGVRRIEAIAGGIAEEFMYAQEDLLHECATLLKSPVGQVVHTLRRTVDESTHRAQELKTVRRRALQQLARDLGSQVSSVNEISLLTIQVDLPVDELRTLAEEIEQRYRPLVQVLAATCANRCHLLVRVSHDLVATGIHATTLVQDMLPSIRGSGGGRVESAQASGTDPSGVEHAFARVRACLQK